MNKKTKGLFTTLILGLVLIMGGIINISLIAQAANVCHVNIEINGNGSATSEPSDVELVDTGMSIFAGSCVITASPDPGYRFVEWTNNSSPAGTVVINDASNPTSTVGIMGLLVPTVSFEATFEPIDYSISALITPTDKGMVQLSKTTAHVDDTVSVRAIPSTDYTFSGWNVKSGGVELADSTKATTTFTMGTSNVVLEATFVRTNYRISASVTPQGKGTAEASQNSAHIGDQVSITATPNSGYKFKEWIWDKTPSDLEISEGENGSSIATFIIQNENVNATAVFEPIDYSISASVTPTGKGMVQLSKTTAHVDDTVSVEAIPSAGYVFGGWNVKSGGVELADSTKATTTFTMGTSNVVLEAIFEPIDYSISTSVTPQGAGTVSAIPVSGSQETRVTLKAEPAEGYQFKNWIVLSGGVTIANPTGKITTFEIGESNVNIEAVFAEITITGISLNSENAKKDYIVGDELNVNNLVLTITKSDGSTETTNVTEDMISGFDSSKPGKQVLTVTYGGYTDVYEVEIASKENDTTPTNNDNNGPDTNNNSSSAKNTDNKVADSGNINNSEIDKNNFQINPDTSDNRNFSFWILSMLSSVIGIIFTSSWWKNRKNCHIQK